MSTCQKILSTGRWLGETIGGIKLYIEVDY